MNGFLGVDAVDGTEYFMLSEEGCAEAVAIFLYRLAVARVEAGCQRLTIYLDNNSTHKDQMRADLTQLVETDARLQHLLLELRQTPRYSPDFNLVEYLIHLARQKLLHHLPAKSTLAEVEHRLSHFFSTNQLQSPQQIRNIINRILHLGGIPIGLTSRI